MADSAKVPVDLALSWWVIWVLYTDFIIPNWIDWHQRMALDLNNSVVKSF